MLATIGPGGGFKTIAGLCFYDRGIHGLIAAFFA